MISAGLMPRLSPRAAVTFFLSLGFLLFLFSTHTLNAQTSTVTHTVYSDALDDGWRVERTRANLRIDNRTPTYEGSRSFGIQFHGGPSIVTLRPHNPPAATTFQTLQFAIYGLERGRSLSITMSDQHGNTLHRELVDVPFNSWSVIEIPYTTPDPSLALAAISFEKGSGADRWDDFYLDAITLSGVQQEPTAAPSQTATAGPTSTSQPTATATTTAPATATATSTVAPSATATSTPIPTEEPQPTATATSNPPSPTPLPDPADPGDSLGIWISPSEVMSLPNSGAAWNNVLNWAQESSANPNIGDQNDQTDAVVMAKALVYVRTGQSQYRDQVIAAIVDAMGTEQGAGILAVARNLAGYVVAADLVVLDSDTDAVFRAWLDGVRFRVFDGAGPSLSLDRCHEKRPNNFGTHCGTSRMVSALYLGDQAELQNAATVFRGWLGDRSAYTGFSFGVDLSWHCDPNRPVGINPACSKDGHPIGGVLPDDQRRAGSFTWPAPRENYVWEALQGAVAQARILQRLGYDSFSWSDSALLRAASWLYLEGNNPASGDDSGVPWLINDQYATNFPATTSARPGKNGLGWYEWFSR